MKLHILQSIVRWKSDKLYLDLPKQHPSVHGRILLISLYGTYLGKDGFTQVLGTTSTVRTQLLRRIIKYITAFNRFKSYENFFILGKTSVLRIWWWALNGEFSVFPVISSLSIWAGTKERLFYNLQSVNYPACRLIVADLMARLGSIDIVLGETNR